jgi:ribonuclease HII
LLYDKLQHIPHQFAIANPELIIELNLHYARYDAMKRAVERFVGINIEEVVVDGKFTIPNLHLPQKAVIKGDAKYWQIGAASILAKVKRDRFMAFLATHEKYSHYDWENNAGYYTPNHRDGIVKQGLTDWHRKNHKYVQYSLFEHRAFQDSNQTEGQYLKWVQAHKEEHGISRYNMWLRDHFKEEKKTWGEESW